MLHNGFMKRTFLLLALCGGSLLGCFALLNERAIACEEPYCQGQRFTEWIKASELTPEKFEALANEEFYPYAQFSNFSDCRLFNNDQQYECNKGIEITESAMGTRVCNLVQISHTDLGKYMHYRSHIAYKDSFSSGNCRYR